MAAENKILDYIQLINSANIGPVTFYKLLRQYGSAEAALAALPAGRRTFSRSAAQKEFELARRQNIRLLAFDDPEYPENLRAAEDAPPVIYVRGQINCLRQPLSLSIVGARNASLNGRKLASQISCELTSQGIMIVSGMARGIDTAAHKGAMFALNRTGSTAFRLHFRNLYFSAEKVFSAHCRELVGKVSHYGRRCDRIDSSNICKRIRNMSNSAVTVHSFHFSCHWNCPP